MRNKLSSLKDYFYRGLKESFVTWCYNNHLKLNISEINELVVDDNPLNMDVVARSYKFQNVDASNMSSKGQHRRC